MEQLQQVQLKLNEATLLLIAMNKRVVDMQSGVATCKSVANDTAAISILLTQLTDTIAAAGEILQDAVPKRMERLCNEGSYE